MELSEVLDQVVRAAQWGVSRSSGPGGQHRDKASTRAELTVTLDSLSGLDPEVASTLAQALGLDERPLRILVQEERSLSRNQAIAIERLGKLVARALAPPAPPRHPTRPTRASKNRRLAAKARRGAAKSQRRPPDESDSL
jgi:ribosome-associated protein